MTKLKNMSRKLLFGCLNQDTIDSFYKLYYRLRYPGEMMRKCSYGEMNSDKVFYVIRPRVDGIEGLMSLFMNVVKNMHYAMQNEYVPVVDFKNYHTQYEDDVKGEKNSWNFYFLQPSNVLLEEVYKSKNVILSGLEIQWYRPDLLLKNFNDNHLKEIHNFIFQHTSFTDNVLEAVEVEVAKLNLNFDNTLGLYLRGTDYIAIKPSGHPVQPTVEQAVVIVDSYLQKYNVNKIFLVTEDNEIFKVVKNLYADLCVVTTFDSFISNYDGKKFLSQDKHISELNGSPYKRGLHYLIKLIILSKCKYFIGGDTLGSWAACIFSEQRFEDKYIFNLGIYGK